MFILSELDVSHFFLFNDYFILLTCHCVLFRNHFIFFQFYWLNFISSGNLGYIIDINNLLLSNFFFLAINRIIFIRFHDFLFWLDELRRLLHESSFFWLRIVNHRFFNYSCNDILSCDVTFIRLELLFFLYWYQIFIYLFCVCDSYFRIDLGKVTPMIQARDRDRKLSIRIFNTFRNRSDWFILRQYRFNEDEMRASVFLKFKSAIMSFSSNFSFLYIFIITFTTSNNYWFHRKSGTIFVAFISKILNDYSTICVSFWICFHYDLMMSINKHAPLEYTRYIWPLISFFNLITCRNLIVSCSRQRWR